MFKIQGIFSLLFSSVFKLDNVFFDNGNTGNFWLKTIEIVLSEEKYYPDRY